LFFLALVGGSLVAFTVYTIVSITCRGLYSFFRHSNSADAQNLGPDSDGTETSTI
jgi:hypothetical protein